MLKRSALAALVLSIAPLAAGASTVTIASQSPNLFEGSSAANVTVSSPVGGGTFSAGAFALQGDRDGNGQPEDFFAFCVDIAQTLNLPFAYTVSSSPASAYLQAKEASIQKLFDSAYSLAAANLTNSAFSSGFQLALWEVVYESSATYSLGSGSFTASSSAAAQAETFLAGLASWSGPKIYDLTFYEGGSSQFLVSGDLAPEVAAVPVPAAAGLLAAALGGLAALKRRRAA